MGNAILTHHIHPMSKKLGDEFVIPTNSFLWTTWPNTMDIYYLEEHTISHLTLGQHFYDTHFLSNELQISELIPSVFSNQLTDLSNEFFAESSMKAFSLRIDIYKISMNTLASTFYSAEIGCVAIYSAIKVITKGQVNTSKISLYPLNRDMILTLVPNITSNIKIAC